MERVDLLQAVLEEIKKYPEDAHKLQIALIKRDRDAVQDLFFAHIQQVVVFSDAVTAGPYTDTAKICTGVLFAIADNRDYDW